MSSTHSESKPKNSNLLIDAQSLRKVVASGDDELVILNELDFQLEHNQTVAILGVSGSGKSTLLSLLAGLDLPTSGTINIEGEELTTISEEQRTQLRAIKLGFIFQAFLLIPGLTALENVTFPLQLLGANTSNHKAKAVHMLEQLGLGERLKHMPSQLSGGEKQRVAIARAKIHEPKILFADEPTGNLDGKNADLITNLLLENSDGDSSTVIVTHDHSIAKRCDCIYHLDAGRLVSK